MASVSQPLIGSLRVFHYDAESELSFERHQCFVLQMIPGEEEEVCSDVFLQWLEIIQCLTNVVLLYRLSIAYFYGLVGVCSVQVHCVQVCGFPYLEPAFLAHRFPGLPDCPGAPTKEPAGIASTCGFSTYKESKSHTDEQSRRWRPVCLTAMFTPKSDTTECSPVSLTDRGSLTLSVLAQHFRTVLASIGWWLDDHTLPVLLLLGVPI